EPVAKQIAKLTKRCRQARIPVVYCNDNFGRWQSNFNSQIEHCTAANSRGKEIAERLSPEAEDYFVLKPKHSAFYNTTLDLLLRHLGAETLVLSGITTDICGLFTANDAYVRGYELMIATDCV